MKRHRSRLFTIPLRFILSIVFLLSVVEMVGRYEMNHDNRYVTLLLQPIPAYQNAPFWSQAFQTDLSSRKLSCNYQDGYVYHSQYFNVDHCIRRIVGQPTNVSRRIWLFGSSTLYTGELPDDWTIASQLQALLPNWRIEQRTSSGAPVLVMLTMLREQDIRAGDIVIFYDGWTDSVNAFQNAQQ